MLQSSKVVQNYPEAKLTLLTINDVYEIEPGTTGIGGMAPLSTIIKRERKRAADRGAHSLFFVNGDFLSASQLGEVYKGAHMIHLFNELGVDFVVFGNHEFDFGNDILRKRINESKFKWFGTNVLELDGKPFGGSESITVIEIPITRKRNGPRKSSLSPERERETEDKEELDSKAEDLGVYKVGLFGVCTLSTPDISYPDEDVQFSNVIECSQKAVDQLRNEHKVDLVVAVTHLALGQDKQLAREVQGIDVIIGGHDHVPTTGFEGKTFIHKSGQSAEYLCRIDIDAEIIGQPSAPATPSKELSRRDRYLLSWKMIANKGWEHDQKIVDVINYYTSQFEESMKEEIGEVGTNLDSTQTRFKENTMSNFMTDAIRETFGADLAILNGGFIRGNRYYEKGHKITLGDMQREVPFPRHCVLIELTGKDLLTTLETGVRSAPEPVGYFLHLSKGSSYSIDIRKEPFSRVSSVIINGKPLDPVQTYKVVVTDFLFTGGDGFTVLQQGQQIKTPHDSKIIMQIIIDYVKDKKIISPVLEGRIIALSSK